MRGLPESVSTSDKKLPIIDELKGYAICLVILYHIGGILGWPNWLHGEVGVDVFLLVSGFALARSGWKQPWRTFVRRRFLRIYPAYWIAFAFFYFLRTGLLKEKVTSTSLLLHIMGVHGFAPGRFFSELNDSFWFISLIVALYAVFLSVRRYLPQLTIVMGIGLLLTTVAAFSYRAADHGGGLISLAVRIPSFFLGLFAGHLASGREVSWKLSPLFAAGSLSLMILGWKTGIIPFYAVAGVGMTTSFIVLASLLRKIMPGRDLLRIFSFVGLYSYEIYLFHQPLIRDFTGYVSVNYFKVAPERPQLITGIWMGLALTLVLAIAVHHILDKILGLSVRESSLVGPNSHTDENRATMTTKTS